MKTLSIKAVIKSGHYIAINNRNGICEVRTYSDKNNPLTLDLFAGIATVKYVKSLGGRIYN